MKFAQSICAVALTSGLVASSALADNKPAELVEQRQAAMTLIRKYFGPVGAMVNDKRPYDANVVAKNTAYLEVLAQLPWDGFDPTTVGEKGSHAKPDTYKDKAKFDGFAKDLETAMAKLAAAGKGGDRAAVKTAFGDAGKVCKSCHDSFSEK